MEVVLPYGSMIQYNTLLTLSELTISYWPDHTFLLFVANFFYFYLLFLLLFHFLLCYLLTLNIIIFTLTGIQTLYPERISIKLVTRLMGFAYHCTKQPHLFTAIFILLQNSSENVLDVASV